MTAGYGFAAGLVGDWALSRQVSDGSSMSGAASFVAAADGTLRYEEHGELILPGQGDKPFQFARRYLYRFDGDSLVIFFDEPTPRLFENVPLHGDPAAWRGAGSHDCAPDRYDSTYAFSAADGFRTIHDVEGPRKSYRIETLLSRSPLAP